MTATETMIQNLKVMTRYDSLDRALAAAARLAARKPEQYAGKLAVIRDEMVPGDAYPYVVVTPGRQLTGYALGGELRSER